MESLEMISLFSRYDTISRNEKPRRAGSIRATSPSRRVGNRATTRQNWFSSECAALTSDFIKHRPRLALRINYTFGFRSRGPASREIMHLRCCAFARIFLKSTRGQPPPFYMATIHEIRSIPFLLLSFSLSGTVQQRNHWAPRNERPRFGYCNGFAPINSSYILLNELQQIIVR